MLILNKKRIYIVLACIVISTFLGTYELKKNKTKEVLQTVALPVSSKVVVIDAGHGVPDERG